jgi:hypothetical protein
MEGLIEGLMLEEIEGLIDGLILVDGDCEGDIEGDLLELIEGLTLTLGL